MTWIDPDKFKFLSQWKYVEIAHYASDLDRVIRDQTGPKGNKSPIFLQSNKLDILRNKNSNSGIYTSVWLYDKTDIDIAKRFGSLYFDLDSDTAEEAQLDAQKLVTYLLGFIPESGIRIYFTGAKGFHVECEAVTIGITPSNTLPDLFRFIANEMKELLQLSTLDFAVYDQRRMWRVVNSQHQKTNLYKIPLSREELNLSLGAIKELAVEPRVDNIPNLEFCAEANAWYRELAYKQEAQKNISLEERIARFNKHGSNLIYKASDESLTFDPISLFTNCPAMMFLWKKAESEHHLLHEERLFLCSILSYTDEAIEYLLHILSNCYDFNPDKSKSHIDDWIRRRELGIGGRPFSCRRACSAGVGCGNCDLEPKERMERVGNNWIGTGEMAEPSPSRFAYRRKNWTSLDSITISLEDIKHI